MKVPYQLKTMEVIYPIPYKTTTDLTLIADPVHGDTLEYMPGENLIVAKNHLRAMRFIPMSNVRAFTPYFEGEYDALFASKAAPAPKVEESVPVLPPITFRKDKNGKIVEE